MFLKGVVTARYMQHFCIEVGCQFLFKDCGKVHRIKCPGFIPSHENTKLNKILSFYAQIVFFRFKACVKVSKKKLQTIGQEWLASSFSSLGMLYALGVRGL